LTHNFVQLHVHTKYSMLDGMCKFDEIVEACKLNNMHACAITDHGYMYGAVEFYSTLTYAGIKPIIGLETYVVDDIKLKSREKYHLILLVKNEVGYKNLLKISTLAATDGFYYKPSIDKLFLESHSDGLIALSACMQGEVPNRIINNDPEGAMMAAQEYNRIFGDGNFYLEMQNHGLPEELIMNKGLKEISAKLSIPLTVTNDVHYMNKEDAKAQDLLVCIKTGKKLSESDRLSFKTHEFYFKNYAEMLNLFPEDETAITGTADIAAKCKFELPINGKAHMPSYDTGGEKSYDEYLEKIARDDLAKKFPSPTPEVMERFEHEITTIKKLGYSGYFLIVRDIVAFAAANDIPVGPGRGSAAGSLVSYVLGITSINPLKYGLLFERFLNPERVSPPDIDMDISDEGRSRIIDFIVNKFGRDKVAQIVTFQQLKPKQAIKDVGRVLDIPLAKVNSLSKLVPDGPKISFKEVMQDDAFKKFTSAERWTDEILNYALKIEGMLRQDSTHAAGVVIAPSALIDYVPLALPKDSGDDGLKLNYMTQYPMESLEKIGLIKFDILGLRNLQVIKRTIDMVLETRNEKIVLTTDDFTDREVYEQLSAGNTLGVFQLESDGMRDILKKMRPSSFEEIIAVISLFRPGPMKFIDEYIKKKKGLLPIEYDFKQLEDVLKETYGIAVYQEQVMQIAMKIAGFSVAKADNLRRAMSKKKQKEMDKIRLEFVAGAAKNSISSDKADELFDKLDQFSQYGFNKSHAAAYAVLAYQTAYLKTHFAAEYMASLLTSVMDKIDKTSFYIDDCKNVGLKVLPPDINKSGVVFSAEKSTIRYGLAAIKNVGVGAAEEIVKQRRKDGGFKDIFDFTRRVNNRYITTKTLESLVKAGAFDYTYPNRAAVYASINEAIRNADGFQKDLAIGQFSLFGDVPEEPKMSDVVEWDESILLTYEKEVLGTYVSSHPLAKYEKLLKNFTSPLKELRMKEESGNVIVGGIVHSFARKVNSKNEDTIHFIIEDMTDKMTVIALDKTVKEKHQAFEENMIFLVRGRISHYSDNPVIFLESLIAIDEAYVKLGKFLHIKMREIGMEEATSKEINSIISGNKGQSTVIMHILTRDGREVDATLDDDLKVNLTEDVLSKLESIAGAENVWLSWKK
jgi:DNA polymerase III subunit alpha